MAEARAGVGAGRSHRFANRSDQGLALVRKHEQAPLRHLDLFCEWLGVSTRGLQFIIDQHRSRHFWHEERPGEFEFRGWSTLHDSAERADSGIGFDVNDTLSRGGENRYIIVGRGYP